MIPPPDEADAEVEAALSFEPPPEPPQPPETAATTTTTAPSREKRRVFMCGLRDFSPSGFRRAVRLSRRPRSPAAPASGAGTKAPTGFALHVRPARPSK